ncbi:hypothetical protein KIPB_010595, partial [Kipferlia bialata]
HYGQHLSLIVSLVSDPKDTACSQYFQLERGVHVLLITPDRLMTLLRPKHYGSALLRGVETLVLDGLDTMMAEAGGAMSKLLPLLPKQRQTAVLSASEDREQQLLESMAVNDSLSGTTAYPDLAFLEVVERYAPHMLERPESLRRLVDFIASGFICAFTKSIRARKVNMVAAVAVYVYSQTKDMTGGIPAGGYLNICRGVYVTLNGSKPLVPQLRMAPPLAFKDMPGRFKAPHAHPLIHDFLRHISIDIHNDKVYDAMRVCAHNIHQKRTRATQVTDGAKSQPDLKKSRNLLRSVRGIDRVPTGIRPEGVASGPALPRESLAELATKSRRVDNWKSLLVKTCEQHQVVMVTGATGCGKSTLVAPALAEAYPDSMILLLQPRRLATQRVADFICDQHPEWVYGRDVGVMMGHVNHAPHSCRIVVATTAMGLNILLA